jgi:hypothetical protein
LNSPRNGCPRGMTIGVWTHLGLIKWKTTSKKIKNGRRPQKKRGRRPPKKKKGRQPQKNLKKIKNNLTKKMEDDPPKNRKLTKFIIINLVKRLPMFFGMFYQLRLPYNTIQGLPKIRLIILFSNFLAFLAMIDKMLDFFNFNC